MFKRYFKFVKNVGVRHSKAVIRFITFEANTAQQPLHAPSTNPPPPPNFTPSPHIIPAQSPPPANRSTRNPNHRVTRLLMFRSLIQFSELQFRTFLAFLKNFCLLFMFVHKSPLAFDFYFSSLFSAERKLKSTKRIYAYTCDDLKRNQKKWDKTKKPELLDLVLKHFFL